MPYVASNALICSHTGPALSESQATAFLESPQVATGWSVSKDSKQSTVTNSVTYNMTFILHVLCYVIIVCYVTVDLTHRRQFIHALNPIGEK